LEDAEIALGQRLIKKHRCADCHAESSAEQFRRLPSDAARRDGGASHGMVEQCNTEVSPRHVPGGVINGQGRSLNKKFCSSK